MQTTNSSFSAFTLVELIVSITISILLMTSIGVFMSSGMQNLFNQQATLKNMHSINDFGNEIRNTLTYTTNAEKIDNNTLLLKRNTEYDKGGYTLVGMKEFDRRFCSENEMDTTKTDHLVLKDFIPFEDTSGNYVLENTITSFGKTYTSKQKEHTITDGGGNTIIGTGYFGKDFEEGSLGATVLLNTPTGLAVDKHGILYIADTLNHRVLYYTDTDITNAEGDVVLAANSVHTLLDEKDGLQEPTGLYYNDDTLYIANSGKGEILSFSSKPLTSAPNSFSGKFSTIQSTENVARMDIEFHNKDGLMGIDFTSVNASDVIFSGITKNSNGDFTSSVPGTFSYYFSDYSDTSSYTEDTTTFNSLPNRSDYSDINDYITKDIENYGETYMSGYLSQYIKDAKSEFTGFSSLDMYDKPYDNSVKNELISLLTTLSNTEKEKIYNYFHYIEQDFETKMIEHLESTTDTEEKCTNINQETIGTYKEDETPFRKITTCNFTSATQDADGNETSPASYDIKIETKVSSPGGYKNINGNINLQIDNIDATEAYGNTFVKILFYDKDGERVKNSSSEALHPITIKWVDRKDGKIYTKDDNIFKVEQDNLSYPYKIESLGTYKEFSKNSLLTSGKIDYTKFKDFSSHTSVLETPISELDINLVPNDLLTLKLRYYRTFNCYNTEENNGKIKTFLFNANLK